jgi:hypothetical protein
VTSPLTAQVLLNPDVIARARWLWQAGRQQENWPLNFAYETFLFTLRLYFPFEGSGAPDFYHP